jgi:hypothetical protein
VAETTAAMPAMTSSLEVRLAAGLGDRGGVAGLLMSSGQALWAACISACMPKVEQQPSPPLAWPDCLAEPSDTSPRLASPRPPLRALPAEPPAAPGQPAAEPSDLPGLITHSLARPARQPLHSSVLPRQL